MRCEFISNVTMIGQTAAVGMQQARRGSQDLSRMVFRFRDIEKPDFAVRLYITWVDIHSSIRLSNHPVIWPLTIDTTLRTRQGLQLTRPSRGPVCSSHN